MHQDLWNIIIFIQFLHIFCHSFGKINNFFNCKIIDAGEFILISISLVGCVTKQHKHHT